jgi:hypothetical protein
MQVNILEVNFNSLSPNVFNLASDLKQNSIYIIGINKEKSLVDAVKKIEENKGYYVLYLSENDYAKLVKTYNAENNEEIAINGSIVFPVVSNKSYVNFIENIVKFKNNHRFMVYKLFNLSTKKIKAFFDINNVDYEVFTDGLDVKLKFDITTLTEEQKWEFLRKLTLEFKDYIYAESDVSLAVQLVKILKMREIKVSTAYGMPADEINALVNSVR